MRYRHSIVSLLVALLISVSALSAVAAATPGLAATLRVNDTGDSTDARPGDGVCADGRGKCTLRAALMEAGALGGSTTITLPSGVITLSIAGAGEDAGARGDLDVNSGTITVSGQGAASTIIDAGTINDRVFDIGSNASETHRPVVSITDVTIRNGRAGSGGDGGGGIRAVAGALSLSNLTLSANSAEEYGGGVLYADRNSNGDLYLPFSGGSKLGPLTLTAVVISGNTASAAGGGIFLGQAGVLHMTGSQVSLNKTLSSDSTFMGGGGLYVEGGGYDGGTVLTSTITIGSSTFNQNQINSGSVSFGGGAIGIHSGPTVVAVTGGAFTANEVGSASQALGGAIFNDGGQLTINGTTVDGNKSGKNDAGAIFISGGTLTASGARFTNNVSSSDDPISQHGGGAIGADNSSTLTFNGGAFSGNHAILSGGAISVKDSAVTLKGVTLSGNQSELGSGGAVSATGSSNVRISDSVLSGNKAPSYDGGAIDSNYGAQLTIQNSTISDNAAYRGGAIRNYISFSMDIADTQIINNTAEIQGGAIYNRHKIFYSAGQLQPPTPLLTNVTISGNKVTDTTADSYNGGGGIYNEETTIKLVNSTISNNSGLQGGAILTNHNPSSDYPVGLDLTNVTISGNTAGDAGGAIYQENGVSKLNNVTIANNTAFVGGGIFYDQTTNPDPANNVITLRNSILAGNSATDSGPDCSNGITSGNYNLIGTTAGCTVLGMTANDLSGDPQVGPLADNGGPVLTQALLTGSPAIGKGDAGSCAVTDGRGVTRSAPCDIGAYELLPNSANLALGATGSGKVVPSGTITYVVNASNAGPGPSKAASVTANLPAGTTFISATGSGWSCSQSASAVTCIHAGLGGGAAPSITLVVQAPGTGGASLSARFSIASATPDPDPSNNSARVATSITGGGGGGGGGGGQNNYELYLPLVVR